MFDPLLLISQTLLLLVLAPLLNGLIKKTKARLQGRRGAGLLQGYYDIAKYFARERVVSEHHSWLLTLTPYLVFGTTMAAGLLVPTFMLSSPFGLGGDFIMMVGLFALGRFFLALAGLDTGSAFGGMGSSREMMVATLVEPGLLLTLFSIAYATGSTQLDAMAAAVLRSPTHGFSPAQGLAFAALLIIAIAETGRIPVDNPDTHLELTMIHEGMLLEYSGPDLATLFWATQIKQMIILSLLANLFLPWGIAASGTAAALLWGLLVYLLKLALLGITLAFIETASAKLRLFALPELLGTAFGLAALAFISQFIIRGV